MLGDYDGPVDRWQICEFLPPTGVIIDVGVARTSLGITLEDHDQADVRNFVLDFATPATERTCTYFWGSARGPGVYADDEETFRRVTQRQATVFLEDVEILEAQQRRMDQLPDRKLRSFGVDSGGLRARMMIDRMSRFSAQNSLPQVSDIVAEDGVASS
jgi:vanillate O-demethylase monooxygenase subunit